MMAKRYNNYTVVFSTYIYNRVELRNNQISYSWLLFAAVVKFLSGGQEAVSYINTEVNQSSYILTIATFVSKKTSVSLRMGLR